jgi:hypothetical protein
MKCLTDDRALEEEAEKKFGWIFEDILPRNCWPSWLPILSLHGYWFFLFLGWIISIGYFLANLKVLLCLTSFQVITCFCNLSHFCVLRIPCSSGWELPG